MKVRKKLTVGKRVSQPSYDAGAFRGSLAGYHGPQTHGSFAEEKERVIMQRRTADLVANDWAASSGISAIVDNSVGTGLSPQAKPITKILGIEKSEARDIARNMEWLWSEWTQKAHLSDNIQFDDLQYLGLRTMLKLGEMLHVPIMLSEEERIKQGRLFSLCIQNLAPQRLLTPSDYLAEPTVHDGVHLSPHGVPQGYYIALPKALDASNDSLLTSSVAAPPSTECAYIPARIGHRSGIFHLFRHENDEQIRGLSPLSTGIRLFRHLTDALDYELYAQVIAAAFPVFFATEHPPAGALTPNASQAKNEAQEPYQAIGAGTMLYGAPGEKPEILESKRPSQNFVSFVEIIMRAMSASLGIPYESLSKDFSKTNYSSARAALNEAWKMYLYYRKWFVRLYCQRIYEMVMEEAYLRNLLVLPKKAPGFYEARSLWCAATWVGPARGYVDPVKETTATVMAMDNHLTTRAEIWKERGADFDEGLEIMLDEAERMQPLQRLKASPLHVEDIDSQEKEQDDVA